MIRNPDTGYAVYDVPHARVKWFQDEKGEWVGKEFPVVTIQCESFEEFCAHHMADDVVMSRQPDPWYISFMYSGECAECEWPIPASHDGDYLCPVCRAV